MICPNCKKENGSGSKFCMYCGTRLPQSVRQTITEQSEEAPTKVHRTQTAGEKALISVFRRLLYISIALLVLSVVSKVVYQESITYGYPTLNSNGYYTVHSTKGSGEQWVCIRIYPLFKVEGLNLGIRTRSYDTGAEVDADMNQLHEAALDNYQDNVNTCIVFMIIATIVIFLIGRYVTRTCTP